MRVISRTIENEDGHESFSHSSIQYLRMERSGHHHVLANILVKPIRQKIKFDKRLLDSEEIKQVIMDFWNSPELPIDDANIMAHILSCYRSLS